MVINIAFWTSWPHHVRMSSIYLRTGRLSPSTIRNANDFSSRSSGILVVKIGPGIISTDLLDILLKSLTNSCEVSGLFRVLWRCFVLMPCSSAERHLGLQLCPPKNYGVAPAIACASPSSAVVTYAIAYARVPHIYRVLQDTSCHWGAQGCIWWGVRGFDPPQVVADPPRKFCRTSLGG